MRERGWECESIIDPIEEALYEGAKKDGQAPVYGWKLRLWLPMTTDTAVSISCMAHRAPYALGCIAVSYTHLTLPTKRIV